MIKCALTITLLLTAGTTLGTANVFTVDFATLGSNSFDISSSTTGGLGQTLGNVTFLYDDFGDAAANGTAQISASGIDGFAGTSGLGGSLNFLFNATPALGGGFTFGDPKSVGLLFHFTVGTVDGSLLSVSDGAVTTVNSGGTVHAALVAGAGTVLFPNSTAPFNIAGTFFTADSTATNFNVSDITYTTPEPASFLLPMGMGMLGLGFARRFSKRRS